MEQRAGAEGNAGQDRTRRAQDRASVSQGLDRVRHVARQRKKERFTALLHHVTPDLLRTAFFALRRQAARRGRADMAGLRSRPGSPDRRACTSGSTGERTGHYRRRGYIPKADGSQRPLAIAALEDKIVQRAMAAMLNADLRGGLPRVQRMASGRGAARMTRCDALAVEDHLNASVNWILDADIRSFFDAVDQDGWCRF